MTQPTQELDGHQGITAAEAWFMLTGKSPTPEQAGLLDAILTELYRRDFACDPPLKFIFPDAPCPPIDEG